MKRRPGYLIDAATSGVRSALVYLDSPDKAVVIGEFLFRLLGMRRQGSTFDLSRVRCVLLVRLDEIGDVTLTAPFLRELRRLLPDAWISLVVKPAIYNLVECCPYVNEVLTYNWNSLRYVGRAQRHWRALHLAVRKLWRRRFDLAMVPRWEEDCYHASYVAYFSGAPWRLGYSEKVGEFKRRFNRGFDRLFTHVLDGTAPRHEVERSLDIIRFLGGTVHETRLELWLNAEDADVASRALTAEHVAPTDLVVAFGPGAAVPRRRWPLDHFAALGAWLITELKARLVLIGGPGEEALGKELQRRIGAGVVDVVGRLTLRQSAALLKRAHLYIGNDSGPLHLAAAAGIPVVEISCHPQEGNQRHPSSPKRFGPWTAAASVLQPHGAVAPCGDACEAAEAHCIQAISVQQVKQAVRVQLAQQGAQTSVEEV